MWIWQQIDSFVSIKFLCDKMFALNKLKVPKKIREKVSTFMTKGKKIGWAVAHQAK